MSDELKELGEDLAAKMDQDVKAWRVEHGELTLDVRADRICPILKHLRDDPQARFLVLIDIAGVDYPERTKRFDIVYHLLSMHNNVRIRLKTQVGEDETMESVREVFPNADWYEREIFDMYGVPFAGLPDMRRLLTDYGFEGHPLRKDFPLTGHTQVKYDDELKKVVYEPVSLVQEYRGFDYESPWEGAQYALPGDEKAS
ncbi:MAG: NADH-quinone oxidoreductase subunit C [Pseudomonadota bacterium]